MNRLAYSTSLKDFDCEDAVRLAERELSALVRAVKELFGSEQAKLSAEEWLRELNKSGDLPASAREWRSMTTSVLTRLANRLSSSSSLVHTQHA